MKKLNRALFAGALALLCTSCHEVTEANYQVIPLPQETNLTKETPFELNGSTTIVYPESNAQLKRNAEFLAEYLTQSAIGIGNPSTQAIAEGAEAKNNTIVLGLDPTIENKEGYVLTVTPQNVFIKGKTESGVFYGIQTLRKSIPPTKTGFEKIVLPAGTIKDAPRFPYRGMHLDVGRHFFPVEFIKEYIDLLALHNMNTFHWHLGRG